MKTRLKHSTRLLLLVFLLGLFPGRVEAQTVATVTIKNDALSEADGAAWDGTLFDEAISLEDGDTMATVLTRAAEEHELDIQGIDDGFITTVNGLGEGAAYPEGWNSFLNDWAHDTGIAETTVNAGDTISLEYSLQGGADIGSVWGDSDQTLASLEIDGTLDPAFSKDTTDYSLPSPKTPKP